MSASKLSCQKTYQCQPIMKNTYDSGYCSLKRYNELGLQYRLAWQHYLMIDKIVTKRNEQKQKKKHCNAPAVQSYCILKTRVAQYNNLNWTSRLILGEKLMTFEAETILVALALH